MFHKLRILLRALTGEIYVLLYKFHLLKILNISNSEQRYPKIIVSLTSYGRRVEKAVPYTIMSLMRQTLKPDIIILNLDEKEWNNDNLPKCLLWLKEKGLTINFTRDIRSYTKLIPTLKLYPNEIIISVDDDIVYSKHLIKSLFNEYTRDSNAIWAIRTCDKNDYKKVKWRDKEYGFRTNHLLGTGGVLYPPHSLNDKVFEEKVWTKVAPIDDDIWFFMMGLLNGFDTKQVNTANRVYSYEHDLFYQIMHKGSRLKDHLKIDNALNDIINHYHIDLAKLSCQSVKNRIKYQLPLTQL